MKRSIYSGMRFLLATAATAALASIALTGCMSSSDSTEPGAEVETSAENGANNAALANEAGTNDASNVAGVENAANGEAPANAAGGELQNLVNDGTAAAAANPSSDAAPNNAGSDPFAAALNNSGTPPPTNVAADPFAPPPADAMAAAPTNVAADPFAPPPADAMAAAAPEVAPAPEVAVAPEVAPASDAAIPPAPGVSTMAAAPMPEGGVLPETGAKMPYYIKKGDTLAKIAALIYGDSGKWQGLAEENGIKNASLIYAGDVILYTLSEKSQGFAQKYEAAPRASVKVAQGDTLSSLAKRVFGSQGEWRTLWKMNPSVKNPDVIKAGMVLVYREVTQVASNETEELLVSMNE